MKRKTEIEIEKVRELWLSYGWVLISDLVILNIVYLTILGFVE